MCKNIICLYVFVFSEMLHFLQSPGEAGIVISAPFNSKYSWLYIFSIYHSPST
jgi:hypothetical protein